MLRTHQQLMADFHEDLVAQWIGGRRTPRSGAGAVKGDVTNEFCMVECKATMAQAARVMAGLLESVVRETARSGLTPVVSIMRITGSIEQRTNLTAAWTYFIWPWRGREKTVVSSLRLDGTLKLPAVITFDTRPGYPRIWRIGCLEQLLKAQTSFRNTRH